MSYDNDQLVYAVKLGCMIPDSHPALQNDDILRLATDQLSTVIVPAIMALRESYFLRSETFNWPMGLNWIFVPPRAAGVSIESLWLGKAEDAGCGNRLMKTDIGGCGYWFEGSKLYLKNPRYGDQYTIRYFVRPSCLVSTNCSAKITQITKQVDDRVIVTLSSLPIGWVDSSRYDIVRGYPHHDLILIDQVISGFDTVAQTITYAAGAIPPELAVGDYLAISGQTPIAMIPDDWIPILVQATICKCLEVLGDAAITIAQNKLGEMMGTGKNLLTPRALGNRLRGNL